MAMVRVLKGDGDELIGDFEFEHLPREGEEISIPSAANPTDVRIFTVKEVAHVASGAHSGWGFGPLTILRYCEEYD